MATVLAISSLVARGRVGLAATVPALEWLGHEVWAMPTVMLASRPGLGRPSGHEVPPPDLAAMLGALEADGCWPKLGAVLTGYFPSPRSAAVVAAAIRGIRRAVPKVPVLVDPIMGDNGRLYVGEATAAAIRDELMPLATMATPNLFELGWLTGAAEGAAGDPRATARRLGPSTVVVTSAAETGDSITTLAIEAAAVIERTRPRREGIPNGAGDLFAGLLLGRLLNGDALATALDASLADLDRVLAASAGRDALDVSMLRG
ncbi:MAG: bifunctional hydroxymethylpyrimidine kinase/phosphomethylpyrimidine kinase [Hyphomicrobiaceae bacterium]|nr:bifunctional hydroxymethylpyrimidine kinase/phosphomethylpyrimidine kinase [Hyphomicrobiaceae bacterium]